MIIIIVINIYFRHEIHVHKSILKCVVFGGIGHKFLFGIQSIHPIHATKACFLSPVFMRFPVTVNRSKVKEQ